jgi:hypothetical protein
MLFLRTQLEWECKFQILVLLYLQDVTAQKTTIHEMWMLSYEMLRRVVW